MSGGRKVKSANGWLLAAHHCICQHYSSSNYISLLLALPFHGFVRHFKVVFSTAASTSPTTGHRCHYRSIPFTSLRSFNSSQWQTCREVWLLGRSNPCLGHDTMSRPHTPTILPLHNQSHATLQVPSTPQPGPRLPHTSNASSVSLPRIGPQCMHADEHHSR